MRAEYARTVEPARTPAAEAQQLDRRLSDLVNQAYGLTPRRDRPDVGNRATPDADRAADRMNAAGVLHRVGRDSVEP